MVKLCRKVSHIHTRRKEPLGCVIPFLSCPAPFMDTISLKFGRAPSFEAANFQKTFVYIFIFKYFHVQSPYLFHFCCQIRDTNLNILAMHVGIEGTKTSFKGSVLALDFSLSVWNLVIYIKTSSTNVTLLLK